MSETTTPTPDTINFALFLADKAEKDGEQGDSNRALVHLAAAYRASTPVSQKAREALEFYANESRYNYDKTACPLSSNPGYAKGGEDILADNGGRATEALTLLAPDTRTEYDKAVEALAPYLPDGWYCLGAMDLFCRSKFKPVWRDEYPLQTDAWFVESGYMDGNGTETIKMPPCPEGRKFSIRHVVSGKVVPHV